MAKEQKEEKSLIDRAGDTIKEVDQKWDDSVDRVEKKISTTLDSGIKKTTSFFKKLLVILFVAGILCIAGYMLYANYTYSEGTRAGDLIKISKKGYVFKTYEGQLKLGGIDLQNQEDGLSDTWSFSVSDDDIFRRLEALQGSKVILRYKEINRSMPWQGDTNYFIYDVEEKK